jgi:hypothetical protein
MNWRSKQSLREMEKLRSIEEITPSNLALRRATGCFLDSLDFSLVLSFGQCKRKNNLVSNALDLTLAPTNCLSAVRLALD